MAGPQDVGPAPRSQVAEAADGLGLVQHVGRDLHAAQRVQLCSSESSAGRGVGRLPRRMPPSMRPVSKLQGSTGAAPARHVRLK
jgi:hypothetical protein